MQTKQQKKNKQYFISDLVIISYSSDYYNASDSIVGFFGAISVFNFIYSSFDLSFKIVLDIHPQTVAMCRKFQPVWFFLVHGHLRSWIWGYVDNHNQLQPIREKKLLPVSYLTDFIVLSLSHITLRAFWLGALQMHVYMLQGLGATWGQYQKYVKTICVDCS